MYLVELTIVFSAERGGRDDQLLYESTTFKHRSRSIFSLIVSLPSSLFEGLNERSLIISSSSSSSPSLEEQISRDRTSTKENYVQWDSQDEFLVHRSIAIRWEDFIVMHDHQSQ